MQVCTSTNYFDDNSTQARLQKNNKIWASFLFVHRLNVVGLVSNGIEIYRRLASFRLWHEIVAQLIRMLSPVLILVTVAFEAMLQINSAICWWLNETCFPGQIIALFSLDPLAPIADKALRTLQINFTAYAMRVNHKYKWFIITAKML